MGVIAAATTAAATAAVTAAAVPAAAGAPLTPAPVMKDRPLGEPTRSSYVHAGQFGARLCSTKQGRVDVDAPLSACWKQRRQADRKLTRTSRNQTKNQILTMEIKIDREQWIAWIGNKGGEKQQ